MIFMITISIFSDSEVLKKCRQVKELVVNNCSNKAEIFQLLLQTAELELKMKEVSFKHDCFK